MVYDGYTRGVTATTLKVSTETRDRVKALGDAELRTADQVINFALDLLERDRRRTLMREQSRALGQDADDLQEMRAVQAEMEDLRAR